MPTPSSSISRSSILRISASSIRNHWRAGAIALALLLGGSPLTAQQPGAGAMAQAAGRVLRVQGFDSVPVPDVRIVLHRVGRELQGPIDSMQTRRGGRFGFRFIPDTTAVYILSVRYQGIVYFSPPVHTNPARPDTAMVVLVADTSSKQPIQTAARHLVISRPGPDGVRSVIDLLVPVNPGPNTRVARDSSIPTWAAPLPANLIGFQPGQSDFSPDAIVRRGDSMVVLAPISPGERQILVRYGLPADADQLTLRFDHPVQMLNVLLEDPGASVTSPGITLADSQVVDGRVYQRWSGAMPAGGTLRVRLPGPSHTATLLLVTLVGVVGLGLIAAAAIVVRRRRPRSAGVPTPDVAALLEAVARLDAQYAGRAQEVSPDEWAGYQAARARLKAELEAALASRRGVR
ncbi:MAG TPA: hypothetical protein VFL95_09245 [Gemmatimonadales bacterium]|nr:hypothetical protein [Gemmatimonadales bacterium]